jgi:hypothetical protein
MKIHDLWLYCHIAHPTDHILKSKAREAVIEYHANPSAETVKELYEVARNEETQAKLSADKERERRSFARVKCLSDLYHHLKNKEV